MRTAKTLIQPAYTNIRRDLFRGSLELSLPALGSRTVGDAFYIMKLNKFQRIEVAGDVPLKIRLVEHEIVTAHRMQDALPGDRPVGPYQEGRSEEHTSELQSH